MDIMAIAGLLAAAGLIFYGISDGGDISNFINSGAAAVTFGGTLAALIIAFPPKVFASLPKLLLKIFIPRAYNFDPWRYAAEMEKLADDAKRNGLLHLDGKISDYKDEFIKKGLQLTVDSEEPKIIREILEEELGHITERHRSEILFFEKGAVYAPGFGMLGTLSGLINIFANSSGQLEMSGGMAAALITTFYGLILSNCIFLPLSGKLQRRNEEETLCRQIVIEGVISISSGETIRQMREKLISYIPPAMKRPHKIKLPKIKREKKVKINKKNK